MKHRVDFDYRLNSQIPSCNEGGKKSWVNLIGCETVVAVAVASDPMADKST